MLLLVWKTSRLAAWALIALLDAVFPANLFMYKHPGKFGLSPTLFLLGLGLNRPVGGDVWDQAVLECDDLGLPRAITDIHDDAVDLQQPD